MHCMHRSSHQSLPAQTCSTALVAAEGNGSVPVAQTYIALSNIWEVTYVTTKLYSVLSAQTTVGLQALSSYIAIAICLLM